MSTDQRIDIRPGTVTPVQVESEIVRLCRRLEDENHKLTELGMASADRLVSYKAAQARARIKLWDEAKAEMAAEGRKRSSMTVDEVEARVEVEVEDVHLAHELSEILFTAQRDLTSSLRTQISALQTISSNLRAEMQWANRTQG